MPFDLQLQAAKQALALPNFKRDDLLTVALTEPSDLDRPDIPPAKREHLLRLYRRLAFLGDALLDTVLADYLFHLNEDLTQSDLDDWRQATTDTQACAAFALDLGLPKFSSSWRNPHRLPPETQPRLWAEMFEAVVAVVFLDRDRDFAALVTWVSDRFLRPAIGSQVGDPDYNTTVTTADYLDMLGLEGDWGSSWAPGDDDD